MADQFDDEPFIDTPEVAKLLGNVSTDTIEGWRYGRRADHGPPYYRLSHNCIRYKRSEVLAWAKQHRFENGVKVAPAKPGSPPRPWEQPR